MLLTLSKHMFVIFILEENILLMVKNFKLQLMKLMRKNLLEKMLLALDGIWIFIFIMEQEHIYVVKKLRY